MTIGELKDILDAQIFCGEDMLNCEVQAAKASDMMSEVLACVKNHSVLLTGLLNPQVIRTAEMMDMQCIVFVRGKTPTDAMLELAADRNICVLSTKHTMFTTCGLLFQQGLKGEEEC